jgi:predicted metallo-beta-lactamase superfamily hydrolase
MKVIPLAAESLGVRSMATYVEAGRTSILIDPGATLAPNRYNLPPADGEWEAYRRAHDRISAYASRAAWVFVSHYHEDHFRTDTGCYAGRVVLAKHPERMVQGAQARRAAELWRSLDGAAARVQSADSAVVREPEVTLEVSPPLPHGLEGTTLGCVVALTVVDHAQRERFVFASDVQGPLSGVVAGWIAQQRPTLLYLSGPPSYMEHEIGAAAVDRAIANLLRIVEATGCRVIMDHHALRDRRYAERFERLFATGRVVTAAAHVGVEDAPLEARRHEAWRQVRKPAAWAGERRATIARRASERTSRRAPREGHGS